MLGGISYPANARFGASGRVPADKVERLVSVRSRDLRRGSGQWASRADRSCNRCSEPKGPGSGWARGIEAGANGSNFFSAFQALWLGARARWQARSVTIGGPAPFGRFLPSIHHAGCAQCRWQTRIFTRSRAGSSYSARSCTRHLFSKARRDPGDLFFTRSLSSRRALRAAASIIRQDLEAAGH